MGVFDDVTATWRNLNYFGSEGAMVSQYKRKLRERELKMLHSKLNPRYSVSDIMMADHDTRRIMLDELDEQIIGLNEEGYLLRLNKELFSDVLYEANQARSDLFNNIQDSGVIYNYTVGLLSGGLTSFAWNLSHLGLAPENILIQDFPGIMIAKGLSAIPTPGLRTISGIIGMGGASAIATLDSTRQSNLAVKELNYFNDIVGFSAMELVDPYEGLTESAAIGGILSLPIVSGIRLGAKGLLREVKRGTTASYDLIKKKMSTEKFVSSVLNETKFDRAFGRVINNSDAGIRNQGYKRIMESNRALEQAIKARDSQEISTLYNARLSQLSAVTDEVFPGQYKSDAKTLNRVRNFVKESQYKVEKREVFITPTKEILSPNKTLVEGSFNVVKKVVDEGNAEDKSKGGSSPRTKTTGADAKLEIIEPGGSTVSGADDLKRVKGKSSRTAEKISESGSDPGGEVEGTRRKRVFSYDNDKYDYLTYFREEAASINKKVLRFSESRFNRTKAFKDTPDDKKADFLRREAVKSVKDTYYDWKEIDLSAKKRSDFVKHTAKFNSNIFNKLFVPQLPMDGFSNKHLQTIPEFLRADFLENHFFPGKGVVGDTLVSALNLGLPKVKFTWPEVINLYEISHLKNPEHADAARLYNRAVNHYNIINIMTSVGDDVGLRNYVESYSDAGANMRSTMNGFIAEMSDNLSEHRYKDKRFGEMILDQETSNDILRGMVGDKNISDVAKSTLAVFKRLQQFTMETYSDLGYGKDQLVDFFVSSYDRLILEKYGTKTDFIETLVKNMDIKRTLQIPANHPGAEGRARAFATEMYNGILSRSTEVHDVISSVDASRKKYFPKNGNAYIDILDKFGSHKSALDIIGTYVDKHANTLARIQLYGDPFKKGYFIEHTQQFTGATPRVVDSVYSTLDFIYSGAFPSHETFFTESLGWFSSIKNAANLMGSSLTAFTLDKAPMAMAIADATKQPFLGVRRVIIDSFKPSFYKNKVNFNKAMLFSENITRHTEGLMRDNANKLLRTRFDEFMSKINGLRSVTQSNFFITEYTITHAWHEMGTTNLSETQPKAFGITLENWELFMTSDNAVTSINGVGIRHPRQLMVHGSTVAEREVGRKIGHYLARTVNSAVLNSLDTKSRKMLYKGGNLSDSPLVKFFTNELFVYATAPLQIMTRVYPMMLRMVDRSRYGELASIVVMATAFSYARELMKDVSDGRIPSTNIKEGLVKAFLNNDVVLGYFGQSVAYNLFQGDSPMSSSNLPLVDILGDVSKLAYDLGKAAFTEEDPEKKDKILGDLRRVLDRDITIRRYPIIGAYVHRQLMDAIFSGVDSNYEESIVRRQEMYREEGYSYWYGEK